MIIPKHKIVIIESIISTLFTDQQAFRYVADEQIAMDERCFDNVIYKGTTEGTYV